MLELQNLTKIYKTKSKDVVALDNINLYFEEKGMVFITGKSGSGKTTMLNVIGGLDSFDSGKLIVKGKSFDTFNQSDFDSYRNSFIGFVFQEYNLLEEMTVEKNISLAMELQGQRKKDVEAVNDLLKKVDLEGVNARHPSELSGGQKQRIAIARALIKKPQIILTDEPTGALDTQSGIQVMDLLKELSQDRLVIIVSHNLELAKDYADRIIQMKDGKIEKDYQILRNEESDKINIRQNDEKIFVRRGAKLNSDEAEALTEGISQSKDVQIVEGKSFSVERPTVIEKKEYDASQCKFIKGKLGFFNNLKLGFGNLRIKPLRLVITILLCAIAFSVFGLFDTMAIYDQGRLTSNTLKNSNVPAVILLPNVKNDADSTSIKVNQQLVDNVSSETHMSFKGVYKPSSMLRPSELGNIAYLSKYYLTSRMNGFVEFAESELDEFNLDLLCGRYPTAYDEIAVSKYYAQCIINWGYLSKDHPFNVNASNCNTVKVEDLIVSDNPLPLTINRKVYKLVGILDAGKVDSKYDGLLKDYASASSTLTTEFTNYINNSFYMYAFVKSGFADYCLKEAQDLVSYNTLGYTYAFSHEADTKYTEMYSYSDLLKYDNSAYFFDKDKTTLNDDEILVNAYLFDQLFATSDDSRGFSIERFNRLVKNSTGYSGYDERLDAFISQIKNARTTVAEKFAALDGALALMKEVLGNNLEKIVRTTVITKYDTTQYAPDNSGEFLQVKLNNNEYKIVGFYSTGKAIQATTKNAPLFTSKGLENLGVNNYQGYYDSLIAVSTNDMGKIGSIVSLVSRNRGINYTCNNNVIRIIDTNKDFLDKMSTLFLIASSVFAVFATAMMANYIATSINNKHTEIGILRALGSSGADVLKMFLTESIIIALINIVLSNVLTGVSCMFLNDFLKNIMNINITLASYTARQFGVICAMSLGVAMLASILPIVKLSRQKPIEAIRRN